MAKGRNVLTTGDVAKICNVAARTVSKWFDGGQLKGYRIPGSRDRRIPVRELIRFMKSHDIPSPVPSFGRTRVLIADTNNGTGAALAEELKSKTEYEVRLSDSVFETGAAAFEFAPHVLLVNLMSREINAADICKSIRSNDDLQTIRIIALANHLNKSEASALLQQGFDGCVMDPGDAAEVISKIEQATAIIY